jgi:hypothetical protein
MGNITIGFRCGVKENVLAWGGGTRDAPEISRADVR